MSKVTLRNKAALTPLQSHELTTTGHVLVSHGWEITRVVDGRYEATMTGRPRGMIPFRGTIKACMLYIAQR